MLNGILVIDKDAGMTSSDVVYQLRRILHIKKIGHAGTLDPEVTGVLPIAIGQATKLIELMHTRPKTYEGEGILGFRTDSYDLSGEILETKPLSSAISADQLQAAMNKFVGNISQVPPIYSAVKVNGKHLYEYARAGIAVERPSRNVQVFDYQLRDQPIFDKDQGQESFAFKIVCSKGTYVRSLVNDLADYLAVPAVMSKLRRTASSGYTEEQAIKLSDLIADPALAESRIQPIESFFARYLMVELTSNQWKRVQNGAGLDLPVNDKIVGLKYQGTLKAMYQKQGETYRPWLMLLQNS